ncbi:hypothetical protein [Helicobacter suis]|uniref:hypothetical protein n=1 Tax=Helicobacter suis TaxID=104628 RepID=UPI0013D0A92F|nr:hypothetical protein [Helicobacter suis]
MMEESIQAMFFSTPRLKSYSSCIQHEDNFALIARISPKIGILEIVIRNKINIILSEKNRHWWLELSPEIKIKGDIKQLDSLVSKQSMGFWVKVVEYFKIYDQIFSVDFLDCLDFKKYNEKNKNRFSDRAPLRNYQKATLILQLLHTLRNRTFHFENLYKHTPKGDPRLSAKIKNKKNQELYTALHPDKILLFLNDLLESFHPKLASYAEKI